MPDNPDPNAMRSRDRRRESARRNRLFVTGANHAPAPPTVYGVVKPYFLRIACAAGLHKYL
jgi:hypothetical protein